MGTRNNKNFNDRMLKHLRFVINKYWNVLCLQLKVILTTLKLIKYFNNLIKKFYFIFSIWISIMNFILNERSILTMNLKSK